ncbi:ATP-dependent Zn protease [Picosynechococcus sp. PCC 7003]|uniref:ATP-dependent Zn protease n=1 Tax=Picosynechococcus sp. PCC 7003 TaxID=374981 RepID=UPI000810C9C8|nr:ATP-dependent Zn protease [Picosynechococcus sp. PCC 7003]ANV85430.1 ATP-dependent Zn protease [Picosynechococcus sp. PCC 7003]
MQQTALNLIVIGVFLMTMTSLLGGIFQLSPFVPAGITAAVMAFATVDTFNWQGRGMTLFLDLFTPAEQRQRILHHEAGHFLAGYLLSIPITGYSLTPWEAIKQGQTGQGGVSFDLDSVEASLKNPQQMNLLLERLSTTLMAGIAAETNLYGKALGGANDRDQLRQLLAKLGISVASYQQREQWALLQAKNLLDRHQDAYQDLVTAMAARAPLEECYRLLKPDPSERSA